MLVAGASLPLLRRRAGLRPGAVLAGAAAAPVALAVLAPRSRKRDVALCALQMWAYLAAYKLPHDDESGQEARVLVDYPIVVDRAIGLGEIPSVRLQRAYHRPGAFTTTEAVLAWAHWLWFIVPHASVAYVLIRRPESFPRAAAIMYATFDVGASFYWLIPTAPPWYAEEQGRFGDPAEGPHVRRLMADYGEHFWGDAWERLYSVFGGNPLAAMPSLHFATSTMASVLLAETGAGAGAVGWAYTATLGAALVFLGEHYVADLLAGAALAAVVHRSAPRAAPLATRAAAVLARIGRIANPESG